MWFNKSGKYDVYAPVNGKCIDIELVNDRTFAEKMLGDGVAIIPSNNVICSPADGEIIMLFNTLHAFGIRMKNGNELLIHIGIDTVELNGEGFTACKCLHETVKKGQEIIRFDGDFMKKKNIDMTTMIVVTKQVGNT
ncbi:MAG: PTS glucose transporter subunit IIA, partial [Longicatena sp.]